MSEIFTANHMQEFFLFLGATVPTATARCVAGLPVFRHAETVTVGGAAPGKWVGEPFAVDSHSYYRVELISRATAHAMVGFTYSDALGQLVVADNYDRISAAADWTTTVIYLRPPPTAVAARMTVVTVAEHPCDVQAIRVDRVTEKKAGDWIATVLRKLPPLVPEVDDDGVLARLPQTHRLLAAGRSLRTVFLGDSIVNDICNGLPGLQLKRLWPAAAIEVIPSVTSAGGCVRYQAAGEVRRAVLDHAPDLVVIGGISHYYDIDAIRSVIRQIRAACAAEIVVMTGAVCSEMQCREYLLLTEPSLLAAAERVRAFGRGFSVLSHEQGVATVDLRRLWQRWLDVAGYPSAVFMRDSSHANRVGKLVLAALVADQFRDREHPGESPC